MPQFNIHWKGCPHRHLPRIRLASSSYGSIQGRSHAHIAAQDVVKLPLGPALEKIRRQQRIRACRRRRGSRGSFGFHRRTSGRARKNPLNGAAKDIMASALPYSRKINRASMCMSGALQIADGDQPKDTNDESKKLDSWARCEALQFEYPEANTPRTLSMCSSTRPNNPRHPTKVVRRRPKSSLSQSRQSEEWRRPSSRSKLSTCIISTSRRRLSMRKSPSSSASTVRPINKVSDMPFRTLSQQKALKVFTRELERHLVAQEAFRKAGLDKSSTSSSSMSAQSIVEFMPYSADFRAAGLAVTSKEQRGLDLPKWRTDKPSPAVPIDGTQGRIISAETMGEELRGKESPRRSTSGMASTTCMETASTDSTVIVFASMDGASPSRERTTPSPQRIATRKTLPWLREADARDGFHSKAGNSATKPNDDVSSSGTTTLASMTTIIDFSPEPEKCNSKGIKIGNMTSGLRTTDTKWLDMENKPSSKTQAVHEQPLPSTPSNEQHGLGDNKKCKTSPVVIESKTSGIGSTQLRADRVFQGIVRNAKLSTAHVQSGVQSKQPAITTPSSKIPQGELNIIKDIGGQIGDARGKTTPTKNTTPARTRNPILSGGLDLRPGRLIGSFRPTPTLLEQQRSPEKYAHTNNVTGEGTNDARPELTSPARSPPPPPMEPPSFTSRVSPILTPTCIPDQYDYDTPSVFEETLHQVTTKSHSPGEWSKHNRAGTSMPATQPSHRCSCDPVKRKPHSLYRPSKAAPQTSATTSRSTLKSALISQSQSTLSTEQSVTRNRDVFKGLQIALAAACDEDMDAWITEVSGCRVRRFLADLRVFEGLGANALVDEAMRTARRRRKKMEAYRARAGTDDGEMAVIPCAAHIGDVGMEATRKGRNGDFQMGVEASDMGASASARRTALMEEMTRRKETRKGERERGTAGRKRTLEWGMRADASAERG